MYPGHRPYVPDLSAVKPAEAWSQALSLLTEIEAALFRAASRIPDAAPFAELCDQHFPGWSPEEVTGLKSHIATDGNRVLMTIGSFPRAATATDGANVPPAAEPGGT